jgi:hypothetical protein
MEKKSLKILLCLMVFFFLLPRTASAARSLSILSSDKSALFGEEELIINASASGFTTDETIYIKGAFYQDKGTTNNYFGYTKNGNSWIKNGETTTSQRKIKIGEWDNNLHVKVDFADSGYKGEGHYKLRVGFYYMTSGGNISPVNWSTNNIDLDISEPDPTPTPTDEPTPTKTPTPTKSQISYLTPTGQALGLSATNALSKKTATKTAAPKDIPSPILKANDAFEKKTPDKKTGEVLVEGVSRNNFHLIALGIGVLTLSCAILFFIKIKRRQTL